ncbi:MAG: histidine kinase [Acidobacteria bacterium]|nr:histidine kinase [Acidobacteriota bacterium]
MSTTIFLLDFFYRYLDDLAREKTGTFAVRFIEEATGVYSAALLFLLIVKFARRFRIKSENWPRLLPVHLLAAIAFSIAHTTILAASRKVIFPLVGMGAYDYGIMPIRYMMEFANYALWYAVWVTLIHLFDHYRASREHELRAAHLETKLAQAQLQALQAQIHPHFLFNALNTISTVIYEDPQAADRMITRLSDFLRKSLQTSTAQEVTLQEELNFLDMYLDIMRPRFEDRLKIEFEVEPEIYDALAPKLILQPLVENSIKYSADPNSGMVRVAVRASRDNGHLTLEVEDDGPGLAATVRSTSSQGIGLTNTAERLERLYGADQEFSMRTAERGGLLVSVKLPYHTAATSDKQND